jgi:hypothetical protein
LTFLGETFIHRAMAWFILQISLAPREKETMFYKN